MHAALAGLGFEPGPGPPRDPWGVQHWGPVAMTDAEARLAARGLIDGEGRASAAGRAAREEVERRTDAGWTAPAAALGADLPELVGILMRWNATVRAGAGYYPSSPQEAVMTADVQRWVAAHGLPAFPGVPA